MQMYTIPKFRGRGYGLIALEKMFIYEVFTKPMIEANNVFKDDDEDQEFASQREYADQIFAQKLAEELAKKDILEFKKLFL